MNSIYNEQPNRKITPEFIEKAVNEAATTYGVSNIIIINFKKSRENYLKLKCFHYVEIFFCYLKK